MTRSTYIASRIALAKQILANPWDAPARAAYHELKRVYLESVAPMSDDTQTWREGLPALVRAPQAE